MTDWRVDLCRRSYAAFAELDAASLLPLYHPDCEWELGEMALALGETSLRGYAGLEWLVAAIEGVFPDYDPIIDETRAREDGALLVRFRASGTGQLSEAAVQVSGGQVLEFEDRRIRRVIQTRFPPPGWDEATPVD